MSTTPAGWYDDGHGAWRWWDGAAWTAHVQTQSPVSTAVEAAQPAKPRLRIVFVVLGAVVVVGIVLATILAVTVFGFLGSRSGGTAIGEDADVRAAESAVVLYDESWSTADCAKYQQSTTADFRDAAGLADCASFTTLADQVSASTDGYTVTVSTSAAEADGSVSVRTTETYSSLYDQNGDRLD
ncbi:MAG: DUF2510 domain-containing protein, partial [Actinobacteria bacterium]|nr:DUF2510 domain-containing protein [Actinomycetota bacterium]